MLLLLNSVYLLCRVSALMDGAIDLICILIRSGVIGFNFHRLRDNLKNTGAISFSFFVGTVGTLGQHELAFGFRGSIGVERDE